MIAFRIVGWIVGVIVMRMVLILGYCYRQCKLAIGQNEKSIKKVLDVSMSSGVSF